MAKSPAFIRIKADVLAIVADIPSGRFTTYAAIGESLDVMARHVSYILAMLRDEERDGLPWHRVISNQYTINRTKHGRGEEQRERLIAEGMTINAKGQVESPEQFFWSPDAS